MADGVRVNLRDYQNDGLAAVDAAEARGVRRQLGVAATGLGKTVMFASLAARRGGRAVVLAHRDELVEQAVAKIREIWPDVDVGIVKGPRRDVHAHVVVASVQTLARENRLAELLAPIENDSLMGRADPFGLVVVDEAHHAAATSYRSILAGLRAGEKDGPLLLGVTATPDRGDGKGLDDLFDEIVFAYDIVYGIGHGYLSDLRGLAVVLDEFDTSTLKSKGGDYDQGQAGRLMESAGAPALLLKAWQEHGENRKTLAFTPTVSMAEAVAAEFVGAGVSAAIVHAKTPLDERREMLAAFDRGEITVMANCGVLTEGYDCPSVQCVMVARPTKSRALYVQMVGRGTRLHPDKADCLIIDVVGATADHKLVTIPTLFGKNPKEYERDPSPPLCGQMIDEQQEQVRLGRLRAEEVELLGQVRREGIAWIARPYEDGRKRYERTLGKDRPTIVLAAEAEGTWLCGLEKPDGSKSVLITGVTLETAQGVGSDYIRRTMPTHLQSLAVTNAAWRSRRPSNKQRSMARRVGVTINEAWNSGELSDAIDAAMRTARERRRKRASA